VKNRMREICTSGSVRGGDGNIPTYSAFNVVGWCQIPMEGSRLLKMSVLGKELQLTGGEGLLQIVQKQSPEHP